MRNNGCVVVVLFVLGLSVEALWGQQGISVAPNGKVGIGTATPAYPLHVVTNDGSARIRVEDTSSTLAPRTLFEVSNYGRARFTFENRAAPPGFTGYYFDVLNSGSFIIGRSGSGIGQFVLDGVGNLTITGTLTTAGGLYPDYVFAPEYQLMPLADLARHIEKHRSLPNMPSAEEVGGGQKINVSELQLRLLEKVEELTLYTLQQDKTIAQQQAAIQALEGRLQRLEEEP